MISVVSQKKAIDTIRANMTKAGCTEEHIESAVSNYLELSKNKVVEVAKL